MSVTKDKKTVLEIANKTKEARLKNDLKRTEVAEKARLSTNFYAKVELGETKTFQFFKSIYEARHDCAPPTGNFASLKLNEDIQGSKAIILFSRSEFTTTKQLVALGSYVDF